MVRKELKYKTFGMPSPFSKHLSLAYNLPPNLRPDVLYWLELFFTVPQSITKVVQQEPDVVDKHL